MLLALGLLLLATLAQAGDVVDQVARQLNRQRIASGNFVQVRELVGVKKALRSEGRFVVDKQRGVQWQTAKPFSNTLTIGRQQIVQQDGTQVLMRLSGDKEPAIRTVGTVLFATFAGDFATLQRYFTISGEVRSSDWQLQLVPKDAALGKLIGKLTLDGSAAIAHIRFDAASGDITRIEFRDVRFADQPGADETINTD
ncbi:outer membrane lipoprotein carrier protein LolA [Andreprevotia lacus]|jgi:outer membrane lipoprotein-sorting protein|nr:outer membrane lipoprotein carrier protein LolA [Andreprevotia lacus]